MDEQDTRCPDRDCLQSLNTFFWLNYFVVLLQLFLFLFVVPFQSAIEVLFCAAVLIGYSFVYLIPAGFLSGLGRRLCRFPVLARFRAARTCLYALAVLAMFLSQFYLFADGFLFKLYGFHINGFVWNILLTKGGIASLAAGSGTMITVGAILAGGLLAEVILLLVSFRLNRIVSSFRPVWLKAAYGLIFLCLVLQAVGYGLSHFNGYTPVLSRAAAFPGYFPVTFRKTLQKWGFTPKRNPEWTLKVSQGAGMNYPLANLKRAPNPTRYNIVWLAAESWAASMLDKEIMPSTWEFAQKSIRFVNHYSGGNGTRMGVFSMFYGLYGNYWFPCLHEQRPPVLMELLQNDGYQFECFTSAAFTYPEFDKTVFARIPKEHLHEAPTRVGWQSDRINVSKMLDFLQNRDPDKPFMTFLFFESPHAPYNFPPEAAIRTDYLQDFNYATTDIRKNITGIKNRYINACHHLDTQIARILDFLESQSMLDSTIVIITGDHGQEFMEHGRWGHNSDFTQEQIQVPLVLWIPGREPKVIDSMTSHLDLPATLLTLLGVTNPPAEYSLGLDLLGPDKRTFTVVADWNSLCYIDADCKVLLPLKNPFFYANLITTFQDNPAEDPSAVFTAKQAALLEVMKESALFTRGKGTGSKTASLLAH